MEEIFKKAIEKLDRATVKKPAWVYYMGKFMSPKEFIKIIKGGFNQGIPGTSKM